MRRRKLVRRASAKQLEFKPTQGPLANDNVLYHSQTRTADKGIMQASASTGHCRVKAEGDFEELH
jgi:hypothetical protein